MAGPTTAEAQQRATQAISGIATALTDITQELHNAQQQLQYWRVEADSWKARYEQERARNERLRKVLRCTPLQSSSSGLCAQPSLTSTPKALRGTSSVTYPLQTAATSGSNASGQLATACSSGEQQQQQQQGAGVVGRRSSSGVKSPLSPQQKQQQQPAGWSDGICSSGRGTLSPPRQQREREQSFTQNWQQLQPLKCVPEGHSNSSSSSELSQHGVTRQPGSTSTPAAAIAVAAAAAAVAPAGSDSPNADPFASYAGPVSDPGEPPELRNHDALIRNALQPQRSSDMGMGAHLHQNRSVTTDEAPTAAADASAAAGRGAIVRSRTMPVNSSFSAVQSPTFAVGFGPGSFLHQAASWLPPAVQGSGGSRHTVDQLLRVMMAFTLMQGAAGDTDDLQNGYGPDEDVLPSVSLDDDDGSSGVGLAAAAAVSAAMARAWATAASREQRAVAASGGQGAGRVAGRDAGSSSSGRAGFRLVATVTNKMGKRQASTSALSSQDSMTSLDSSLHGATDLASLGKDIHRDQQQQHQGGSAAGAAVPSPKPPGLPPSKLGTSSSSSSTLARSGSGADAVAAATAAAPAVSGSNAPSGSSSPTRQLPPSAAAAVGGSPVKQQQAGVPSSTAAKSAPPAAGAAPNSSQATTISLQWLSRPRTVLVMRKLAPSTEPSFLRALDWLRRHQVTMFVEPKVFQELVDAGRVVPLTPSQQQQQQQQQQSKAPISSSSSSSKAGDGNGSSEGTSLAHTGSNSCLAGMLISTAQQQQQQSALFPVNSWTGPSTGSSGGSSATAVTAGAVVGAGGAAAGVIKTWQPELLIDQSQQQQQKPGQDGQQHDGNSSGNSSMVQDGDLIPEAVAQQLDLVVVLGGDGTVLWTCHIFGNRSVPPLVPFNLGSLGFLTPFDPARLEQVLLKTFRGGFPITLRHRLHCTIVRCSTSCPAPTGNTTNSSSGLPCVSTQCVGHCVYGEEHVSLNEVVIERGISPFLTNLECFCDGTFVTHVQGDGLIVGTPTGSTAYSLAAGGSMVHPQVPCILFTPICPHSLSFRPLMFPDYVQLCVQVPADARGHVWASFDGKDRTELGPGDAVVIRLSKWPVPSVAAEADPSSDWFSAVRECLHWNMRKVQGGAGM